MGGCVGVLCVGVNGWVGVFKFQTLPSMHLFITNKPHFIDNVHLVFDQLCTIIFFTAISISFNKKSYSVTEDEGSVTVAIAASDAPQSTASFEVILQDGTAQGIDVGIGLLIPDNILRCVYVCILSHLSYMHSFK